LFILLHKGVTDREEELKSLFYTMDFLRNEDTESDIRFFVGIFKEMIGMLGQPFHSDEFDFADDAYFKNIYDMGDRISKSPEYKKARQARGPKDALYINRTYFGLYNILNQVQARVRTTKPDWMKESVTV
ncbi:MAG: AarF/ABC1/UbiB kinase family protein, partial [Bacteroidota bacterium]